MVGGGLRDETSQATDDPDIKFEADEICDGLVLCEDFARLKQERRRRLKLGLLATLVIRGHIPHLAADIS